MFVNTIKQKNENMKRITLFLAFILNLLVTFSQSAQTSFSYDRAGNRISRRVILLSSARISSDSIPEEEKIRNSFPACKVTVYPNPTEGEVNLVIYEGAEEAVSQIAVYSDSGQLLITREVKGNTEVSVDLSSYSSGVYLIDFIQGESRSYYKVIKK